MGKRKREKTGAEKPPKQTSSSHTALHNLLGNVRLMRLVKALAREELNFDLVYTYFLCLVQTVDVDRFLSLQWAQKPVVFRAASFARSRQLAALFDLAKLWECINTAQQSGTQCGHYSLINHKPC